MTQRRQIVKEAGRSRKTRFFAALSDVPRNIEYEDGEKIYIKSGANYAEYVFRRTSTTDPGGGQLLPTGVTTGSNVW